MTSVRMIPRYVDHLWYPILVKFAGYHHIIEMQGKEVNEWNDMVREQWVKTQRVIRKVGEYELLAHKRNIHLD